MVENSAMPPLTAMVRHMKRDPIAAFANRKKGMLMSVNSTPVGSGTR